MSEKHELIEAFAKLYDLNYDEMLEVVINFGLTGVMKEQEFYNKFGGGLYDCRKAFRSALDEATS